MTLLPLPSEFPYIWEQFNFLLFKTLPPPPPTHHRVYRVPGFLSYHPNWVPPPPHPQESVVSPSLGPRGETHSHAGEGVGGSQFRRWDRHSGDIPLRYITVHYKHLIFLGDLDSAMRICILIIHRKAMYLCLLPHQGNPVRKRACHDIDHYHIRVD
jgi:hypothetical protein